MTDTGQDRFLLAGVMGWPVMHSRSPVLHGHWIKAYGLKGGYVPLPVPPDRCAAALKALPLLGFSGCNLTMPHKVTALTVVDEVDAAARAIGAVNCVTVMEDGRLAGTNTDGFGFLASLEEEAPGWRAGQGPIVLVGAGGAARSLAYSLTERGARKIRLVNRTRERAEVLAADLGGPISVHDWADRETILEGAALLVNATNLGMVGNPPLDLDLGRLPSDALVADIVYVPQMTPLLEAARARGNTVVGGLGMLLHQARPCWQLWCGIDPQVTPDLWRTVEATF